MFFVLFCFFLKCLHCLPFSQHIKTGQQGPVVQSINSLTSSLMVKMLPVLVRTISNSQVFLLKNVSSFCFCKCKSYSHFFSKTTCLYAIFNDQSFNDTLIYAIVSFEHLGPVCQWIASYFKISPLRYMGYATITRHGFPGAPKKGMRNNDKTNTTKENINERRRTATGHSNWNVHGEWRRGVGAVRGG